MSDKMKEQAKRNSRMEQVLLVEYMYSTACCINCYTLKIEQKLS